jgi:hypothetical protein
MEMKDKLIRDLRGVIGRVEEEREELRLKVENWESGFSIDRYLFAAIGLLGSLLIMLV